ncbi:hypothetical protein HYX14_03995 [Candidatus Woesearchaeota archaeon]|nr:hypothetical protein [Candidatus Woesearchaeota archaeon]
MMYKNYYLRIKMITATTRRWGNSLGLIIPKEQVEELYLQEDQQVVVEIVLSENPLKELFGFGKKNKITLQDFLETRRLLEGSSLI